jgi:hypothetical protein
MSRAILEKKSILSHVRSAMVTVSVLSTSQSNQLGSIFRTLTRKGCATAKKAGSVLLYRCVVLKILGVGWGLDVLLPSFGSDQAGLKNRR